MRKIYVFLVCVLALTCATEADASDLYVHEGNSSVKNEVFWKHSTEERLEGSVEEIALEKALGELKSLKAVILTEVEGQEGKKLAYLTDNLPAMLTTDAHNGLDAMSIVVILTKVVQEQQKMIKEQRETLLQLHEKVTLLEDAVPMKETKKALWKKGQGEIYR